MAAQYVPDRGDVLLIDFSPQVGHEQSGSRPAVVLSPANYNGKVGLVVLCPITSQIKGYPFEVPIPDGYKVQGVILSDQVKSLDWGTRRAKFLCKLPIEITQGVMKKLGLLITFS